jgi:hypothetical protein
MARLLLVCTVAAALDASAWAQTGGTGQLSGRVVHGTGDLLPGVTITLTGNGVSATAVTDAGGRYLLDAFVIGSAEYTLTASLAGFETTTRTRVRLVPGETGAVEDVVLRLGCAGDVLVVERSIQAEARAAALIAHVRIESIAAAREWRTEHACVIARDVTAWVEADTEQGRPRRMRFLAPMRQIVAPGDEFVQAFGWELVPQRHTAFTFPVRVANGIATLDDQSVSEGLERQMGVDELLRRVR